MTSILNWAQKLTGGQWRHAKTGEYSNSLCSSWYAVMNPNSVISTNRVFHLYKHKYPIGNHNSKAILDKMTEEGKPRHFTACLR